MEKYQPMTKEQLAEMDIPQGYKDAIEQAIGNWIDPGTESERMMADYYRGHQVKTELDCGVTPENERRAIEAGFDTEIVWFTAGWEARGIQSGR